MKSNRTMSCIFPGPNESLDLNREFCIEIIPWVDGVASRLLTILTDLSRSGQNCDFIRCCCRYNMNIDVISMQEMTQLQMPYLAF